MTSVAVLTPWFPNRPGDTPGAFVADSALAVARAGWRVGALVVRPWVPPGGSRFVHEMIRGDVDSAAFPLATLQTMRVPTLPRAMLAPLTDSVSDLMIGGFFERMARSVSAEVIHAQTEGVAPIAAQVARRLRLPLVVTLHGVNTDPKYLHNRYRKRRLRPVLASANRIVLVGEPLREFFRSYVGSDENFRVVPNGVNAPERASDRLIFNDGPRRLVSISNLQEGKGIDLTLQALAALQRQGISNWTYRIIGGGTERTALARLVEASALTRKVTFVGQVRNAEIFDHLAAADVFVLPSYREAFGIAYLEAMAAGLLTIGVSGQGPSQFIKHAETGILVPPRDINALAAALRDILTSEPERWRQIARRGQQIVTAACGWNHHAQRLIEVYESVIRRGMADSRSALSVPAERWTSIEPVR